MSPPAAIICSRSTARHCNAPRGLRLRAIHFQSPYGLPYSTCCFCRGSASSSRTATGRVSVPPSRFSDSEHSRTVAPRVSTSQPRQPSVRQQPTDQRRRSSRASVPVQRFEIPVHQPRRRTSVQPRRPQPVILPIACRWPFFEEDMNIETHSLGTMNDVCANCLALHWAAEKTSTYKPNATTP